MGNLETLTSANYTIHSRTSAKNYTELLSIVVRCSETLYDNEGNVKDTLVTLTCTSPGGDILTDDVVNELAKCTGRL